MFDGFVHLGGFDDGEEQRKAIRDQLLTVFLLPQRTEVVQEGES